MDETLLNTPRHAVAVIGGACSGAECAEILASSGCYVTVFEQNAKPFGKIEDGLPRWHDNQRRQEYVKIAAKLTKPGVDYVPLTAIGRDLPLGQLREWGFSAVVLACGAWRDRPVGVPGSDDDGSQGFVYQNPFIYWFNHHEENGYSGPQYPIAEGGIVIGGGLASIDCAKVLMLETVAAKLRARGEHVDVVEMEHMGLAKFLESKQLTLEALGVKPATLIYRRSVREMPVAAFKEGADDVSKQKTMDTREKLISLFQQKFLAGFRANLLPKEIVRDANGKVCGLKVVTTKTEGRKVIEVEGSEEVIPTTFIVSSIGSIPEPIPGLPTKGEFYDYVDWNLGRFAALPEFFGVGNVVTGQGNIAISRRHAKTVSDALVAQYMGVAGEKLNAPEGVMAGAEARGAAAAESVQGHVQNLPKLEPAALKALRARIAARQQAVGYTGDMNAWVAKHSPSA